MIPLVSLCSNGMSKVSERCDCRSIQQRISKKRVRFSDDEEAENKRQKLRMKQRRHEKKDRKTTRRPIAIHHSTEDDKISDNSRWRENEVDCCMSLIIKEKRLTTTTTTTTATTTHSEDDDDNEYDDDDEISSLHHHATTQHKRQRFPNIPIPDDPRVWSRLDVYNWLEHMKSLEVDLLNDLDPRRFLMNGKALCLMTPAMFLFRVPKGGKTLYKDFQRRLCRAVAIVHHNNLI